MQCHPKVEAWVRYADFEVENVELTVQEMVMRGPLTSWLMMRKVSSCTWPFAEFEERAKNAERGRCIYEFAPDHIPKSRAEDLYTKICGFFIPAIRR